MRGTRGHAGGRFEAPVTFAPLGARVWGARDQALGRPAVSVASVLGGARVWGARDQALGRPAVPVASASRPYSKPTRGRGHSVS